MNSVLVARKTKDLLVLQEDAIVLATGLSFTCIERDANSCTISSLLAIGLDSSERESQLISIQQVRVFAS